MCCLVSLTYWAGLRRLCLWRELVFLCSLLFEIVGV